MSDDPFTPAELEAAESVALDNVVPVRGHLQPWRTILRAVLRAVAPLIAARVRAEEREAIARAIETEADAYNARIAAAAGVPNRDRDGMVSSGIRRAAAIARAHRTTPGDDR